MCCPKDVLIKPDTEDVERWTKKLLASRCLDMQ